MGKMESATLVGFCERALREGTRYWYGTYGQKCTKALYLSKRRQYPAHYGESRTERYRKDVAAGLRCVDCVGLVKGALWTAGGTRSPVYASFGCPDRSADGLFEYCQDKGMKTGPVRELPEVPGLLLHKSGHVGVYVGGGYLIEAQGFDAGVVRSKVAKRSFTRYAYLPFIRYPDDPPPAETRRGFGIDVSHYQGTIRWRALQGRIDFAILRATCGLSEDRQYARNARLCERFAIPFGAYHYLKADTPEDAAREAALFYERAAAFKALYFVADVEAYPADKPDVRAVVSAFIDALKKLGAQKTGLYIAHHRYRAYGLDTAAVDFVWVPRYGKNTGAFEAEPQHPCDLHQYSSKARLAGITGYVDVNRVTGQGKSLAFFRGEADA